MKFISTKSWATWFGVGLIKKAPGTFGTLGAIPLAVALTFLPPMVQGLTIIGFVIFSIQVCQNYELEVGDHDRSEIVIDEVSGYLVASALLPLGVVSFLGAFLLFRFFDILKPFPISKIDREMKGGFGVVADDLLAGVFANMILQAGLRQYPQLFAY